MSRSSGLPCVWGFAEDGRYIIAVYEELDDVTILPVTAYEVPEPPWEVPMTAPPARRVTRELTPEEQDRLRRHREQIASELPDLAERDRMRQQAREESTLSGELRRAIHSSSLSLSTIAQRAGISPLALDEFLTGERTLRSDVLDRVAGALGFVLQPKG